MRKLASIQKVSALEPIEGADKIEKATVLGWSCVVLKGEFKPGDLGVFFEIDSILPHDREWAQVVAARKYRIKTIKLKGIVSQGLMLPFWKLPETWAYDPGFSSRFPGAREDLTVIGTDVTDLLGVTKFEPYVEQPNHQNVKGTFPNYIPKTDATRLQSIPEILEELGTDGFFATEKLDGQSMTMWVDDEGVFRVASRNFTVKEGHHLHQYAVKQGWDKLLPSLATRYAIQGEYVGPGVNGNKMGLSSHYFYAFDVYDIEAKRYMDARDKFTVLRELGVPHVPIVSNVLTANHPEFRTLEYWLKLSTLPSQGKPKPREGIVVLPRTERPAKALGGGRFGFKVINPEYLLKNDE